MGFCLVNNVAVAARYAQAELGLARVAIVDFDVHHGNGTEEIFRDDDTVLFASLHQWPFYPGTGGPGTSDDTTLNIPLPAGAGDAEYRAAFGELVEPVVRAFAPDLVLVSAGFDAHADDPLAEMEVSEEGFRELAARCARLAPRLAAVLEGGYNLATLPRLVAAAYRGFTQLIEVQSPGERQLLERGAARGDAELAEQALHVRADRVLGDVEPVGDRVRREVLVEQEQHLELARRERGRDRVGHAAAEPAARAHLVEQAARDLARERRLAARHPAQEGDDPLRRLALQEVAAAPARIAVSRLSSVPEAVSTTISARGAASRSPGNADNPSSPGMVRSSRTRWGCSALRQFDRLVAVGSLADDVEAPWASRRTARRA